MYLIAQSATASDPAATTLDEALRWDYHVTYAIDEREPRVPIDVSFDEERSQTYATGDEAGIQTLTVGRLDVTEVRSARAALGESSFPEPARPSIDNATRIPIGAGRGTIEDHLRALFDRVKPGQFSLECHYAYELGEMALEMPVALVARQDFAEELIEHIAGAMRQWIEMAQPPTTAARWRFALTVWHGETQLLRLAQLSLAVGDIVAR